MNQRAIKDDAILSNLENQLRLLSLEKARISDRWDLITEPTLIPYPIGSTRKGKMLISIVSATLAGCLFGIAKDKTEDKIHRIEEVNKLLNKKNICYLDLNNNDTSLENLEIFRLSYLNKIDKK